MSTELIINASLPETRISMMENGEIQELLIERASGKGIVGNIYKGRVTRVLPGMQAAFVDIGLEKAAFLYVDDVYVHSEIWEEEEGGAHSENNASAASLEAQGSSEPQTEGESPAENASVEAASSDLPVDLMDADLSAGQGEIFESGAALDSEMDIEEEDFEVSDDEEEDEDEDEDHGPVGMGPGGDGDEGGSEEQPQGTIREPGGEEPAQAQAEGGAESEGKDGAGRRRHRRGRRGGKFRRREPRGAEGQEKQAGEGSSQEGLPENFESQVQDLGASMESDRSAMGDQSNVASSVEGQDTNRPEIIRADGEGATERRPVATGAAGRSEFREQRGRDRRIKSKQGARPVRTHVNIQDLLKEGQEVIVQVAKDPIATKGARLTCHISLPGRHLVCMPTIDHVGVSRRIERDEERRRLREHVERYRPKNLGFIVRTASGKGQSEKRIKQDIDYLSRLWNEIREKAAAVTAPALVYEDLNSVLRAIRDWVTEDIDKIIVDSRYHYNEMQKFVSHFMPSLKQKVELYHGDIPIFDAYGISTELSRALERKVWLKSGGYIVIDQAEALVAIDVNTGRYVGKKNLEDTILKTNLEAVQEIAYQLRLRNCGGIIILDLIDMEKEENKQRVYRALDEALKKDRARPTILKISELGLVEMTRKRTRDTMVRALCESCSHCEGKGFIKSKQTVAYAALREIEREGIEKDVGKILVQAHPDVIDILAIDERETLDQLERRYRKQLYLQAVTDYHPEQFEVSGDKKEGAERSVSSQRAERGSNRSSNSDRGQQGERNRRRGRDRNRDRDQNRDQQSGVQGRDRQPRPPTPRNVQPLVEPKEGVVVTAREPDDQDSQKNFLRVIDKRGYATPENQDVSFESSGNGGEAAAPHGDFYDEEDRLAFLRAQAAQDAALAKLRGADAGVAGGNQNRNSGGRGARDRDGDRGGRNNRRGGRRGRRGNNRPQGGGGQPRFSNREPQPQGGGKGGNEGPSGGGNEGGGGSDHSQPPT